MNQEHSVMDSDHCQDRTALRGRDRGPLVSREERAASENRSEQLQPKAELRFDCSSLRDRRGKTKAKGCRYVSCDYCARPTRLKRSSQRGSFFSESNVN